MLWMAISYLMMLISAFGLGYGVIRVLARLCGRETQKMNPIYYMLMGFAVLTVYAQIVSLFTAVTYVFAFIALGVSILILLPHNKEIRQGLKNCFQNIRWFEWILFILCTVFVMFLTSLYPKQYDNY